MKYLSLFISLGLFIANTLCAQQLTWTQKSSSSSQAMAVIGNKLFVGTNNGVDVSSDLGQTWTFRSIGSQSRVYGMTTNGNDLYVAAGGGPPRVLKSSDFGATWTDVTPAGLQVDARALLIVGNDIYVGVRHGVGIYKSTLANLSSSSWTVFNTGLTDKEIYSLAYSAPNILAGTGASGVWRYSTSMNSWTSAFNGTSLHPATSSNLSIASISVDGSVVFASAHNGWPNLFKSTDNGQTWAVAGNSVDFATGTAFHVLHRGSNVYVGFELGTGPVFSHDGGLTWTVQGNGLVTNLDENMSAFVIIGNTIFAGAMSGVWSTLDHHLGSGEGGPVGLAKIEDETGIRIYPNPAQDHLMIDRQGSAISGPCSISIINALGQKIIEQKSNAEKIRLDLSMLNKNSLYFLQLSDAQGKTVVVEKIILD